MAQWQTVEVPQVGDIADHVSGFLDPREVVRVELGETETSPVGRVWLALLGSVGGPFPVENYIFQRKVEGI